MKSNNKEKPRYGILNSTLFLAKDMFQAYPLLIFFLILEILLSVITPVFGMYLPKIAIELTSGSADTGKVFLTLGGLGLMMSILMALSGMASGGSYFMYNGMRTYYLRKLFFQSLTCDYIHVESPQGQAKYSRARETLRNGDWSGTSRLTVAAVDFCTAVLSFIVYSGIISGLSLFVIIILVLLSSVSLIATKRAQNYAYENKGEAELLNRQVDYMDQTASNWKWGKDIRLYHMSGWLVRLRQQLLTRLLTVTDRIQNRYFAAGALNAFTLFLRDGLAYGYLIYGVATGTVTVGEFVLYFGAITGFSGFVGRIIYSMNELGSANLLMNDVRAYLDNTDAPELSESLLPTDGVLQNEEAKQADGMIPDTARVSACLKMLLVEFIDVCFSYSSDSPPVLNHFSMTIQPGEKIALVGGNGAGKTTLIKLLCGFYKPDSGEILLNKIPLTHYKKEQLYSLISAVFQDLYLLPVTVAENVSMKPLPETDLPRVRECLKKAGLYDAISSCPDREESYLLKEVYDGIVLSGGEEQKLLMARALYKDGPLLILDEPTAALDPIAESETYESFHKMTRGKTSLYISHRLASTKFCDRIVFLQNGIAKEVGTHEELLRQKGEYARMFAIQSRYYQEKEEADLAQEF